MAQSHARLWTHLIFSTKHRFPFLSDKGLRADMHRYLAKMLRKHDCETLIVGGVEDHIHALFALSRNYSIATLVKEIKAHFIELDQRCRTATIEISLAKWLRSIFGKPITCK